MIRISPESQRERWKQYLFSEVGPQPWNCLPRCSDPDEIDNKIYKTTKMRWQNEVISIAGQVVYDVTRQIPLIKNLAKDVAGSIQEKGSWGPTGWDYNTMSYQPLELCVPLDAMKGWTWHPGTDCMGNELRSRSTRIPHISCSDKCSDTKARIR